MNGVTALHQPKTFARYLLLIGCVTALLTSRALATPSEEIVRAVAANGVTDVSQAHARQVVNAFRAVTFRVQPRDLPDYVAAAIKLRPDLAANFVAVAVKATGKRAGAKPELVCTMIERIVAAAVAAKSSAAVSIASAAAVAAPRLRQCVIDAAVLAAPADRDQIVEAASTRTTPLAFLTYSASDETGFAPWSGTLHSSNIFDIGNSGGVINSPEQPPPAH